MILPQRELGFLKSQRQLQLPFVFFFLILNIGENFLFI